MYHIKITKGNEVVLDADTNCIIGCYSINDEDEQYSTGAIASADCRVDVMGSVMKSIIDVFDVLIEEDPFLKDIIDAMDTSEMHKFEGGWHESNDQRRKLC